jgi:ABC-type cobalt transport system substrate-binding protein
MMMMMMMIMIMMMMVIIIIIIIIIIKAKFPVHAMKTSGGTEEQVLSSITWVLNGVAWWASSLGLFNPLTY